ncbi:MAG: YkgJ family cysteine cluster protein [Thermoplasmata archaeon]
MDLDTRLIEGFGFACRPECGLCCFTTPRIERSEEAQLRREIPTAPLIELEDGGVAIEARPHGGACHFLRSSRCVIRRLRPSPCRIFPLTVHVGFRAQASVVLTCPGVSLEPLIGGRVSLAGGLQPELEAARARWAVVGADRLDQYREAFDRRRSARGFDGTAAEEAEALRSRLHPWVDALDPTTVAAGDIPPRSAGPERLPLVPSKTARPWALGRQGARWTVFELTAEGDPPRPVFSSRPPERAPPMTADAERLWRGYLHYWVERDALLGIVEAFAEPTDLADYEDELRAALEEIAGEVLYRAGFLARAAGTMSECLDASAIAVGLRATDQDLLDRPSSGERL